MKRAKISIIALCLTMLAGILVLSLAGCGEKKTDFSKFTFDQFEAQDWESKEISYQFVVRDESNDENAGGFYAAYAFPSTVQLYADGSVTVWNSNPAQMIKGFEDGLGAKGYGWWSQNGSALTIEWDLWFAPNPEDGETVPRKWVSEEGASRFKETTTVTNGTFWIVTTYVIPRVTDSVYPYRVYSDGRVFKAFSTKQLFMGIGSIRAEKGCYDEVL